MSNRRAEERLRAAFAQHSTRVLAYALRHTDPSSAHDVVADVFLVAWRRIDELPDEPLPWLLVVARNAVHNRTRSATRQQRLADRLAGLQNATRTAPGADEVVLERATVLAALRELSDNEREALLLTAWDGLRPADAAMVAGCSRHAFEVRLHRARARLRRLLPDEPPPVPRGTPRITEEMSL